MRKNLLKGMLVAIATMGATSVWAAEGDVKTNADIDFSNDIVEGVVKGEVNEMTIGTGGADSYVKDGVLRLGDHSNVVTIAESERAGNRDQVTVSFAMAWGNKNNMGSGFSLKDADGEEIASFQYGRWITNNSNANTLGIDMSGLVASHYNNAPIAERATTFTITIDYATKTIKSVLSCPNPSATKEFSVSLENTNAVATFEVFGYGVGGNTDRTSSFDNLIITTTEGNYNVTSADYTVNFVCDGEVIKSETRTGDVGSAITLFAGDTQDQVIDGQKYIYESNDADGQTIAEGGSTVVTITFRKAAEWKYTIGALADSDIIILGEGVVAEGDAVSYYYPQYIANGGKLYKSDRHNGNPWWGNSYTPNADDELIEIEYTATGDENIIFCEEGENIETLTKVTTGNTDIRASNGGGGYAAEDAYIITLTPGKYKIYTATYGNAGTTFRFMAGEAEVLSIATDGNPTHTASEEFEVKENTDLIVPQAGNAGTSPKSIDYIIIQTTDGQGGVTTAIQSVSAKSNAAEAVYNLQGQRVEKAVKGLDIQNGKKFIAK